MKKTVFLDLQNTILANISVLDKVQLEMLKTINNSTNLFITSNVCASDMYYFNELNGLNLNFIADSGAYLKLNDKVYVEEFNINLNKLNEFKDDIVFLFYEKELKFYIYNYFDRLRTIYPIKPKETIFIKNFDDYKDDSYCEIFLCINKNSKALSKLFNKDTISLKIVAQDYNKIFYRILKKNTNKGYYIPKLKDLFKDSEVIAIGDSREDLAMFNEADIKVAVGNAEDELKEKADKIVDSYLDNGALKYLINNL